MTISRSPSGLINPSQPTPLVEFIWLLRGAAEPDTAVSRKEVLAIDRYNATARPRDRRSIPAGFARDSEAWQLSQRFHVPLIECTEQSPDDAGFDLFTRPAVRYVIDHDHLARNILPWPADTSDAPPDVDPEDPELDIGDCLAWSRDQVAFYCPRGVCVIERTAWNDGYRRCAGC